MVTISVLAKATKKNLDDLNGLMRQLRSYQRKADTGSLLGLKEILKNKSSVLVVARDKERVVGAAILSIALRIGRRIGHVDDVIVHEVYRGQGLGEKIMRKIIAVARAKKVDSLRLTSRPSRVAAHKLYKKVGFTKKETQAFSLKL